MHILAYKEATYARNRCEAMHSELEELRSYKRYVREWVISFVETTRSEKNALYGQLAASQLTVNELKQVTKNQQSQIHSEITARVQAESLLNGLRSHHSILANQLAARNAQLEAAHSEMVAARKAYECATRETEDTQNQEKSEREKQELQASLANMANLANHTQTRLVAVEKQLAAEKLKHKKTIEQVQKYVRDRTSDSASCHSSSSPLSSSSSSSSRTKQQRGLRGYLSPSKNKKRQPLGETQLPQAPQALYFQDLV